MRPVLAVVTAPNTSSAWIPVNYLGVAFALAAAILPDAAVATIAASLQYTYDELGSGQAAQNSDFTGTRLATYTRSATTMTITDTGPFGLGHGLTTGDSVIVQESGGVVNLSSPKAAVPQRGDVGFTVTVTGPTTYTATVTNAGPTSGTCQVTALRVHTSTTITVATNVRSDGGIFQPVQAVRLNVTTLTGGNVSLRVTQGMGH